jgi:hypothetical protein
MLNNIDPPEKYPIARAIADILNKTLDFSALLL